MNSNHDYLRGHLLDLHRETYVVGGDDWVTFRATEKEKSAERPHSLQYALTMHTPQDRRIVGYDNAHLPENL